MKSPGEAAVDLPWVMPCAGSLVGLTRPDAASVWSEARFDPGLVLLLARVGSSEALSSQIHNKFVLEQALAWLEERVLHFVDWSAPGANFVQRICAQQALLAQTIAVKVGCSEEQAFAGALLAPLGWLALCANHPERIPDYLDQAHLKGAWESTVWGLDHTAITRRLCRIWRLPAWLTAIIGNLGLHVSIAEKLGAEPTLFRVIQLAITLVQERNGGLHLAVGDDLEPLRIALGLSAEEMEQLGDELPQPPAPTWDNPADQPYLKDMLRLALENRRQADTAWVERLQTEIDYLHRALEEHSRGEKDRLETLKLSALAELAAGAGHEINNPLAVISGQAQYLLKQLQVAEETLAEETSPTALLDDLKSKLTRPLQTIVGQSQRIHSVLTDLMHFARPPAPHRQLVPAGALLHEVSESLQETARQKQVRLLCAEPPPHWGLHVDAAQIRTALGGMLRNAIEAAPPEGWASVRVENGDGTLKLIVEDNGPGPAAGSISHLFDPFYSGRSAGRGRGFGLSSAWRLARQQGGEVRFDGRHQDITRFVLCLPAVDLPKTDTVASADGSAFVNSGAAALVA